jgi:hypothetical protein
VPADFASPPELPPLHEVLLQTYWDLSTERQLGMSVGPIPLSRAHEACDRLGLDEENREWFIAAVRQMDREYLKKVNEKKSEA